MNRDKILKWLNLPAGQWPPEYYALVGLKPGEGTAAEIEGRILERLELLRKYQLSSPDEASEGMSLLARALDCLTSPDARREYDRSLGLDTIVDDAEIVSVDDVLKSVYIDLPILETNQDEETDGPELPMAMLLPDLDDEVELDEDPEVEPEVAEVVEPIQPVMLLEPISTITAIPEVKPLPPEFLPKAKLLPEPPPLPVPNVPKQAPAKKVNRRRQRYADLVRIRRVLSICERAHRFFTNHEKGFSSSEDAVGLIACLSELRPLLPTVDDLIGGTGEPGQLLATFSRQRLMIDTFRQLLPSQRERLARDFRAVHYRLSKEYDKLRSEVLARKAKGFTRQYAVPIARFLAKYPEIFLVPIGLLALVIAVSQKRE